MHVFQKLYKDRRGRRRRTRTWYYEFSVRGSLYRGTTGYTDQVAAAAAAARIYSEVQQELAGLPIQPARIASECVDVLAEQYARELQRRGRSEQHVRETRRAIVRVADLAGAKTVRDFASPARLGDGLSFLDHLSGRTQNKHRTAVHGMFGWLVKSGQWPDNPCRHIGRAREIKIRYRPFSDEELVALFATEPRGHVRQRADWRRRRAQYIVATWTGLRESEIRSLQVRDFGFQRRLVFLAAEAAKNRQCDTLPLTEEVCEELQEHFAERDLNPGDYPWQVRISSRTLDRDFACAGIPRDSAEGRVNFQSFRRAFATRLARAGVSLQHAQRLMRHSDPRLTANVYTQLRLVDDQATVNRLPRLGAKTPPDTKSDSAES
ncbi:tyrosine-type recombinase/integrase [Planctomycetota bacterium]